MQARTQLCEWTVRGEDRSQSQGAWLLNCTAWPQGAGGRRWPLGGGAAAVPRAVDLLHKGDLLWGVLLPSLAAGLGAEGAARVDWRLFCQTRSLSCGEKALVAEVRPTQHGSCCAAQPLFLLLSGPAALLGAA